MVPQRLASYIVVKFKQKGRENQQKHRKEVKQQKELREKGKQRRRKDDKNILLEL